MIFGRSQVLRASAGPMKNRVLRKSQFFVLVIYFEPILMLRWFHWEVLGRPQGAPDVPRGGLGRLKVPFWDLQGLSKWVPFFAFGGFGGPGGSEMAPGPMFYMFFEVLPSKIRRPLVVRVRPRPSIGWGGLPLPPPLSAGPLAGRWAKHT